MAALNVDLEACTYRAMLGVGGIGGGTFFELNGASTLGREESRSGHFIDRRDYCKLHIISHYVKALLGHGFDIMPIGKVGDDETGKRLLIEMGAAGLDMRYVQTLPGTQTLYSFCFLYPDGSGGNLTTDNSACDLVAPADVVRAGADFQANRARGIALAAPEVSLAAREKMLALGTTYGFWRVAAFNSAEILPAIALGLLEQIDLLAINLDEAAALAGMRTQAQDWSAQAIVETACERLSVANPALEVTITAGKGGSWGLAGLELQHVPAIPVTAVSTAGAGDAFLAGLIAGRVAGLGLPEAQQLATLVAAKSVTSPHTIDAQLDRRTLHGLAEQQNLNLPARVAQLLQEEQD